MKYVFIWLWGFLTYWAINYAVHYDGKSTLIVPAAMLIISSGIFAVLTGFMVIEKAWDVWEKS